LADKFDDQPSIAKQWIPWLRNNDDVAANNADLGVNKIESDLKGLSPAQLKLITDLIDQMKMRNEEDKKSINRNRK